MTARLGMPRAIVAALSVMLVFSPPGATLPVNAAGQDALIQLRIAIGGEAALAGVRTIRTKGTIATLPFRGPLKGHFDIAVALPDRFVTVLRDFAWSDAGFEARRTDVSQNPPPEDGRRLVTGEISSYEHVSGFNQGTVIPALSPWTRANDPKVQAVIERRLAAGRARLTEFLLPLMGGAHSSFVIESISDQQAITFKGKGDRSWRLELDPATHLPARLEWTPPGEAARHTVFSDFRTVNGLMWPHRLITTVGGLLIEDARVTSYELNVALPDKLFRR